MNYDFEEVLPSIYDKLHELSDNLVLTEINGRKQFYDIKNKLFIDFNYKNVLWFENGLAPFQNSDGLWGLIDTKGKVILKPFLHQAPNIHSANQFFVKIGKKSLVFDFKGNVVK